LQCFRQGYENGEGINILDELKVGLEMMVIVMKYIGEKFLQILYPGFFFWNTINLRTFFSGW